jgi:hypothetical protein
LAFVFVLVLLAAIFINPSDEEPITADTVEQQLSNEGEVAASIAEPAEPKEPLAELGVAPGNVDSNSGATEPGAATPSE